MNADILVVWTVGIAALLLTLRFAPAAILIVGIAFALAMPSLENLKGDRPPQASCGVRDGRPVQRCPTPPATRQANP
jgi:hypothetical protein